MLKTFLYSILLLFTIFYSQPGYSQDTGLSRVSTGNGLHATNFNILEGVLTVYLPSDITVAESASGTINLSGNTAQSSLNQVMSKYNMVIENQVIDIRGNKFMIQIPVNLPAGVLSISLQDKQGNVLNRAFFPVRLTKRNQLPLNSDGTGSFQTPLTSRSGLPVVINGPFDGDFQNSFISISGQPVILLSESTRQLVFIIPEGVQGSKVLSLKEGATEFKTPFTVLYVVKVGRDDPVLISRKDGTEVNITGSGSQGVLIESEKQFGKIDLEYNPDLGEISQEKNSPIPTKTKFTAKEEPTLGPSIEDLSKPLELDPNELKKFSQPVQAKISDENEFTSLKQFSDKNPAKPSNDNKSVLKPAVSTDTVVSTDQTGYADILDVKPLLDKQINTPFTPFDTTTATKTINKPNNQKIPELKKTAQVPKPADNVQPTKNETKTVISQKNENPVPPPNVAKAKPIVNPVNKKTGEPMEKPGTVETPPGTRASDYSNKMNDKALKTDKSSNKQEKKTAKPESKAKNESKEGTTDTNPSDSENSKYRKINDLNSLNTKDSSIKSPYSSKGAEKEKSTLEKPEANIKEEKYVSLNNKETNGPVSQPPIVKGRFAVQLASFIQKSEASKLVGMLNAGGYDVYYKGFNVPGKGYWYRVRKGGFSSRNEAEAYKSSLNLSKYHINSFFVTVED